MSNYSWGGSILRYRKFQLLRGLKIFRKTTKFKKFTFGVSKHTPIRKTYAKKKRTTSNIIFQHLTSNWCYFFLKKRTLESFIYFIFAFSFLVPTPHLSYVHKKLNQKNFPATITMNSALVSQKIVYNTSVFRKNKVYFKYFRGSLRYQESSFVVFSSLPSEASVFYKLLPWSILIDKKLYTPKSVVRSSLALSAVASAWINILQLILRLVLHFLVLFRRIFQINLMRFSFL